MHKDTHSQRSYRLLTGDHVPVNSFPALDLQFYGGLSS